MEPVLNARKCPAQGQICTAIPACPEGAITYVIDDDTPLGGRIIFDKTRCTGCGICAEACCGAAIDMK